MHDIADQWLGVFGGNMNSSSRCLNLQPYDMKNAKKITRGVKERTLFT